MMRLPFSERVAESAPEVEMFDVQTVAPPSLRRRFPLVSKSKMASLVTGEFLFRLLKRK